MSLGLAFAHGPRSQVSLWKERARVDARELALIVVRLSTHQIFPHHFNCLAFVYERCCRRVVRCAENDTFQYVERMPAHRHPLRDRVLGRIRRGELAGVREIMLVASIPRQTANRWLREAKIDLSAVRMQHVAKIREQEERYLEGQPMARRPTKAQMRRQAEKAVRDFNVANAKQAQPI